MSSTLLDQTACTETHCNFKVESTSNLALVAFPSAPLSFSNWRPVGNLSSLKHAHPTM